MHRGLLLFVCGIGVLPGCTHFNEHQVRRYGFDWNTQRRFSAQCETYERLPPIPARIMLYRAGYNVGKPVGSLPAPLSPVYDKHVPTRGITTEQPTQLSPEFYDAVPPSPVATPFIPSQMAAPPPLPPLSADDLDQEIDDLLDQARPPSFPPADGDIPPLNGTPPMRPLPGWNPENDLDVLPPPGVPTANPDRGIRRTSLSVPAKQQPKLAAPAKSPTPAKPQPGWMFR